MAILVKLEFERPDKWYQGCSGILAVISNDTKAITTPSLTQSYGYYTPFNLGTNYNTSKSLSFKNVEEFNNGYYKTLYLYAFLDPFVMSIESIGVYNDKTNTEIGCTIDAPNMTIQDILNANYGESIGEFEPVTGVPEAGIPGEQDLIDEFTLAQFPFDRLLEKFSKRNLIGYSNYIRYKITITDGNIQDGDNITIKVKYKYAEKFDTYGLPNKLKENEYFRSYRLYYAPYDIVNSTIINSSETFTCDNKDIYPSSTSTVRNYIHYGYATNEVYGMSTPQINTYSPAIQLNNYDVDYKYRYYGTFIANKPNITVDDINKGIDVVKVDESSYCKSIGNNTIQMILPGSTLSKFDESTTLYIYRCYSTSKNIIPFDERVKTIIKIY